MTRAIWSGSIGLGHVNIAIKAYAVLDSQKSRISLNQLHAECHSRIRQKRFCPVHGELRGDEIVMGFKQASGQFAILTSPEINQLRSAIDPNIAIDTFVSAGEIDPIYFSGTSYYLLPDDERARTLYQVLHQSMIDEDAWGLARAVIYRRDHLVVLRPVEQLLALSVLHYADAIRPAAMFDTHLDSHPISTKALTLAKAMIVARRTDDPGLEGYRDPYNERLAALIEAKIAGVVTPADGREPRSGNAIQTLKSSGEKSGRQPADNQLSCIQRTNHERPVKRRKSG